MGFGARDLRKQMTDRKKLIEVALPLEAINRESAREKSIRHGHPSTLHLWWARRPLAACRAVLFASLVDDPSSRPEEFPTEEDQERERTRLFGIIEDLVKWDNSNNESVLARARTEILKSTDGNPPPLLDPFCGGGSIPLEGQRLGLEVHASDLNPVAVLITKALIEIPPKFADRPAVNPDASRSLARTAKRKGPQGLADDVRYYGKWMRDQAEKRIGHLYPRVKLENGKEATVIAWLWVRTVKCPNPSCPQMMPLLSSFALSTKSGKEKYLRPVVGANAVSYSIASSGPTALDPKKGYKRGMSGVFECAACGTVTSRGYVQEEGKAHRLGMAPTAVVAEGSRGREYLQAEHRQFSYPPVDTGFLEAEFPPNPRDLWCRNFGLTRPVDLFTPRQLVALTTFSDLVEEARERVLSDAKRVMADDGVRLVVLLEPLGPAGADAPGAVIQADAREHPAAHDGRERLTLEVHNASSRVVRVSSHYPFERVNRRLAFDRAAADGCRLDLPAGSTERWSPGETRTVVLVRVR